ncbi:hypothetical protein B0H17DRAFT_1123540 [Mycena rosella]|uniref:Uncharacterized protein n=1 Tax=Mycena rosella TaxID=1033263 RepID=A0AAD7MCC0_MYCRO|nr:hypothetical protein B0H17DRAFT_1123540 [Mycena rosella]
MPDSVGQSDEGLQLPFNLEAFALRNPFMIWKTKLKAFRANTGSTSTIWFLMDMMRRSIRHGFLRYLIRTKSTVVKSVDQYYVTRCILWVSNAVFNVMKKPGQYFESHVVVTERLGDLLNPKPQNNAAKFDEEPASENTTLPGTCCAGRKEGLGVYFRVERRVQPKLSAMWIAADAPNVSQRISDESRDNF